MKTRKRKFFSVDEALSYIDTQRNVKKASLSDRVMKSTKIEDKIFANMREGDILAEEIEDKCAGRFPALRSLPRDVFQCFYSLAPRMKDESEMSFTAKTVRAPVITQMMGGDEYKAIKSVCGGRKLPAYNAALEFAERISENFDELIGGGNGKNDTFTALEKAEGGEERLKNELAALAEKRNSWGPDPALDKKITEKAERLAAKTMQADALRGAVTDNPAHGNAVFAALVAAAAKAAEEKAEETAYTLKAWGCGDDGGDPEKLGINRDVLKRVRGSEKLTEIAKHLGRFKEIAEKARKNGYAYGRGEKYTIEYGADIGKALTSEFAMLANPHIVPVFVKKYQTKHLKQYRRRERITEGRGDIIVCLDESFSAREESDWGKAAALALLDIAMRASRKFALIRFSGKGSFQTGIFIPGGYDPEDVLAAAEEYLGGGTDFETPLNEALRLMAEEGFEKADIVFATDGICSCSEDFLKTFKEAKKACGFTVAAVLLDAESPGMDFSLAGFCESILRMSELSPARIAELLIVKRA